MCVLGLMLFFSLSEVSTGAVAFYNIICCLNSLLVQAQTPGSLWAMDRQTFRKIVLKSAFQKRKMYESFLENVTLLKHLEVRASVSSQSATDRLSAVQFSAVQCSTVQCSAVQCSYRLSRS